MVDLAERFFLALSDEVDSGDYVWDLDYLTDGDFVEIRHVGDRFSLSFVCVNRDSGRKYFERVRPPTDESSESHKLSITQRSNDEESYLSFQDYEVIKVTDREPYHGWHYRDGYNRKDVQIMPVNILPTTVL